MSSDASIFEGPQVAAFALIDHDDKILVVTKEGGQDVLPGGTVVNGESVEQALCRRLFEQLGVTVASLDFCTAIEHKNTTRGSGAFEVIFLFDVNLVDLPSPSRNPQTTHRWAADSDLAALRPELVRDGLIANSFSIEKPWWSWRQ